MKIFLIVLNKLTKYEEFSQFIDSNMEESRREGIREAIREAIRVVHGSKNKKKIQQLL